jgi:hypothetical protein
MRSARLKRDHAGVVHRQQRYSCIIFGLFRRRNKRGALHARQRFDVTVELRALQRSG